MIGAVTQQEVLEYIRSHPGSSSKEIADALGGQSNTPRKLRQLRRWGYIREEVICPEKSYRYAIWEAVE